MADDVVYLDATELARRIRAKELSPVEVVRALRERAGAVNPGLNAIVTPIEDAEERARAAEAAGLRGHGRVPLTGHWPEVMLGFMHAGPLARSVRDVALALSLIAGPDGEDWHAVPVPPPGVPDAE